MEKSFRNFGVITIVAVYLLILVGGIVRSTGSGMGCPDWPRCFGQYVPPTHISQLPSDYKEVFAIQGKQIADFDVFKTWTEYLNRLLGVLIGFFIFITLVLSTSFWRSDRLIFWLSLLSFLLVGFQGWLGSVVVATDLKPITITLHMVLALVIVMLLIFVIARSYRSVIEQDSLLDESWANRWVLFCLGLSLVQVVFGTQVREGIDTASRTLGEAMRADWVESSGAFFYVHRSFSLLVFGANVYLFLGLSRRVTKGGRLVFWSKSLILLLLAEIISGVVMAYFAIPAAMQPLHLLLGSLIVGIQFFMWLLVNYTRFFTKNNARLSSIS